MKAKSNKGKMPGGAPKGMNPLEFFRKGGEQKKAMYKKGGYNTTTQNQLPKRYMGGDDPIPPSQGGNSGMIKNPYAVKKPNFPSVSMGNPFVKPNPLTNSLAYKPSSITRPSATTSVVPAPSPVSVTPTPSPVTVAPAAPTLSLKEQKALDAYNRSKQKKDAGAAKNVARKQALAEEYKTGKRKVKTASDWVDTGINAAGVVVEGMNAVNDFRNREQKGGSIKRKASKGMIVKSKRK